MIHRSDRVRRIVSSMPVDRPVGTWFLVVSAIGRDKAESLGSTKGRHWCEYAIRAAERDGYIRRLPSRIRSTAPSSSRRFMKRVDKETAWAITEKGMELKTSLALGANKPPRQEQGLQGAEETQ